MPDFFYIIISDEKNVKYLNEPLKNDIYFFVDDSGVIMNEKQQGNLKKQFQEKKGILNNDLKAFSVTAVCLTKGQIAKGKSVSIQGKQWKTFKLILIPMQQIFVVFYNLI